MKKKTALLILLMSTLTFTCACSNTSSTSEGSSTNISSTSETSGSNTTSDSSTSDLSITEDEQELLDLVQDDINVVTDDTFVSTIDGIYHNLEDYQGKIYEIEGVYASGDSTPYLYRTIVSNDNEVTLSIPLQYLQKEIPDNSWTKIYGIVSTAEIDGETVPVLEVVAAEVTGEQGNDTLIVEEEVHAH